MLQTYIRKSTEAAFQVWIRVDTFNWLAYMFPLRNISHSELLLLMFTVWPALHFSDSQRQISLISRALEKEVWPHCRLFHTSAITTAASELCASVGFDCSDIQLTFWNLSTQLDMNKSRECEFPPCVLLYNHYLKEMFWLGDALLSTWDYRGLLAFRHPELVCISESYRATSH